MDLKEKLPFRTFHLVSILDSFEKQNSPLDAYISFYFRTHKSIGAKDRKEISDNIYHLIRWRSLFDYFCTAPFSWEKRILVSNKINPLDHIHDQTIPLHVRVSFPKIYFKELTASYSEEIAKEICLTSNTEAPVCIRVNTLKTSRDELFEKFQESCPVQKGRLPNAIIFKKRINFFELPEFKQGFFEVQDEGSQEIAELVDAKPANHVLDYCAGAGGKALAIAPKMHNKGVLYLHDIRKGALLEAKKRLKRASIQNAQIFFAEKLSSLKEKMDWILLDVPCSGSGTLRRNCDLKWKFREDTLKNLVDEQRAIFERAFAFLKEGGRLVYTTCSLFPKENEEQISYFLQNYPVVLEKAPLFWLPEKGGKDGFFGAVLTKKKG